MRHSPENHSASAPRALSPLRSAVLSALATLLPYSAAAAERPSAPVSPTPAVRNVAGASLESACDRAGVPPQVAASYRGYVREMENLRKTNPAAYEKFSKEYGVASVNLWEGRYTQEYPVCVVDKYNVGPQYDLPLASLRSNFDAASLKASLPAFFLDGYTDAYAREQFALGNPAYAGPGGAYDASVIVAKAQSQRDLVGRWEKRFGQMSGVVSQGRPVDALVADGVGRFQAFQTRFPNVRVSKWAQEKERLAVMSWVAVSNGVKLDEKGAIVSNSPWIGKKTLADGMPGGVNPYLLQGDLSQIAISYQARVKPLRLRQAWELEVVRCKDLDGLVASAKAVMGDKQFSELYAQVPAGFEKDSSEHKFGFLRLVMNEPEAFAKAAPDGNADAVRSFAKKVRASLATTSRTPLINYADKLEALDALGLVAKPGTPERVVQEALLKGLEERVFNQALHEISPKGDVEAAVTAVDAEKARADANAAKADLAAEKAELASIKAEFAATKEAVALFKKWESASNEEKRKIAEELRPKVKALLDAEQAKASPDPDGIALLKLIQSRVGA